MAKGFKSGGRRKGSLNIGTRSLGRKRERVRRDATVAITEAMPQLRKWLAAEETWKSDGAQAARMLDGLMKWILPSYGKIDPQAEQAEQAAVERAELPAVTPADILAAFHALPKHADKLTAGVPTIPLETQSDRALGRLSERESRVIRHAGIPLEGGGAYLPKAPPIPKCREVGEVPPLPKAAIDVQPETASDELTAAERWSAQMRPLPDADGSMAVIVTPGGPVVRPRW
jgi:hypothetical protein